MGRDYGHYDALSMSKEMSTCKQTNNSCSFQPTSELIKCKTEKIRAGAKVLSVYKKEAAILMGFTEKVAKVLMSTEMSLVKSAPSSPASSCFDREISFSPTLIDRGRIDEGFYMSSYALATNLFLFNSLL